MFCPMCGQRDPGDHRFCRGCGENLKVISKAMKRGWRKTLNRWLDSYLRYSNRRLPKIARWFRRSWWTWLIVIALFTASSLRDGDRAWLVTPLWVLPLLLRDLWDYVSYRRLSASGSNNDGSPAKPASLPDSVAESPSAPTTNELAPPFGVAEATTRRLEPLAAEKRSGDLL